MKETTFIDQKKYKWHEFEKLSKEGHKDPDKLSELFVEMTEDLSYARTFYPKRSVRVYLNFLAQKVYNSFNKQKKGSLSKFWDFWKTSLPLEMYRSRKQLLTAFLFFAIAILIGVVSSHIDPDFSRVILGDRYVDMTIDNINEGDPMAVYKQQKETSMFLGITINNIKVAFFAFIMGVFFSVGTVFLLVSNGIMLGAFQYFFYLKGLFLTSFLVIWIHGALEISAIIIAGCAGMVLGNGLLFPKTLTRNQSFQINARRGMKILLGTTPIFVVAGFLEGFVTRHTEMPDIMKWVIILTSFAFIITYFVIYPMVLAKRTNFNEKIIEKPIFHTNQNIKKYRIRDLGGIFYDTFGFFRIHFKQFGKIIVQIILPLNLVFLIVLYSLNPFGSYMMGDEQNIWFALAFDEDFTWTGFVGNLILFSLNIATVHHSLSLIGKTESKNYFKIWIKQIWPFFFKTLPIMAAILLLISFTNGGILALILFLTPFFVLGFYPAITGNFGSGLSKGMGYGGKSWGITFVTFLMIGVLCFLFYLGALTPLRFFFDEIINWHTTTAFENFITIQNISTAFMYIALIHIILPLLFIAFSFQFFSMKEQEEAIELNERLDNFGKTSKVYESI
jgi:uncharacterized membrane protein SpoIIM required for sporulation